jgi:hypothetical protein
MNKDFLKGISKENKKEFLSKLQSGKFTMKAVYDLPKQKLNFDLIPESGLYKCQETGKQMSKAEINSMQGYGLSILVVSDRLQVTGEKQPDRIILHPYMEHEYLNSLLKSNQVLSYDETSETFKTESESYSFGDLMRINGDNPESNYIMNEATSKKYVEELEKWVNG